MGIVDGFRESLRQIGEGAEENIRLEAENAKLRESLEKYGKHKGHGKDFSVGKSCELVMQQSNIDHGGWPEHNTGASCTCGLDDALKDAAEPAGESEQIANRPDAWKIAIDTVLTRHHYNAKGVQQLLGEIVAAAEPPPLHASPTTSDAPAAAPAGESETKA